MTCTTSTAPARLRVQLSREFARTCQYALLVLPETPGARVTRRPDVASLAPNAAVGPLPGRRARTEGLPSPVRNSLRRFTVDVRPAGPRPLEHFGTLHESLPRGTIPAVGSGSIDDLCTYCLLVLRLKHVGSLPGRADKPGHTPL